VPETTTDEELIAEFEPAATPVAIEKVTAAVAAVIFPTTRTRADRTTKIFFLMV
jgi:hypothetical protein